MKDDFGRSIEYMRVSVTDLCNLRCRYCMPDTGVPHRDHSDMMTEEELLCAISAATELGIRKIRITGGEPLVKKNILSICEKTAAMPGVDELCITTNGVLLKDMAHPLKQAGVRHINISMDTLNAEKYAFMTRRDEYADAMAGIHAALDAGFDRVKLNAVLIGGFNDDEIIELASLTLRYPADVRFIELMPMIGGLFKQVAFVPCTAVLDALPQLEKLPEDGGVAARYALPGALGCIGLISPLSSHFCASCNRIRLTADGRLKPCLHSNAEIPLKGMDRAQMKRQLQLAIASKPRQHGELSAESASQAGRSMNEIGG